MFVQTSCTIINNGSMTTQGQSARKWPSIRLSQISQ